MQINVESFDPVHLEKSDVIHVRVNSKDKGLISKLTMDLCKKMPHLCDRILVTSDGITMQSFTKDELRAVRDDLNKIIGTNNKIISKIVVAKSGNGIKAYRIRDRRSGRWHTSSTGRSVWLRKPNFKSMYLRENLYELVEFEMREVA